MIPEEIQVFKFTIFSRFTKQQARESAWMEKATERRSKVPSPMASPEIYQQKGVSLP